MHIQQANKLSADNFKMDQLCISHGSVHTVVLHAEYFIQMGITHNNHFYMNSSLCRNCTRKLTPVHYVIKLSSFSARNFKIELLDASTTVRILLSAAQQWIVCTQLYSLSR
jgi:hypothetical protein